jgi:hypothetical protein
MAKHRLGKRRQDDRALRRTAATAQLVDHTGTAHQVTGDEARAGVARGRYTTMCDGEVLPAALVTRETRQCRLCVPIPAQRPGGTR